VVAYRAGAPIRVGQFLGDVRHLAAALGSASHVLNVCTDRYHFCVGLAASLVSGRVSLLPSTTTPEVVRQLQRFAPDVTCLTDGAGCSIALPQVRVEDAAAQGDAARHRSSPSAPVPTIDEAQLAAYVFTSGSTSAPVP